MVLLNNGCSRSEISITPSNCNYDYVKELEKAAGKAETEKAVNRIAQQLLNKCWKIY